MEMGPLPMAGGWYGGTRPMTDRGSAGPTVPFAGRCAGSGGGSSVFTAVKRNQDIKIILD